ncbi:hypothetical protein ATK30_4913 [Amycolatopsis echigonensis]|uniref:Uncharacterized protein n=2 Tax=Pseudonocardiaceae TaxID=2070 RepID=A0A2N3WJJ5_9PSEU|nr:MULTISPECIES: hypothetical protein [Pseudonocardiaceae]AEA23530.1 integral membrane protein [Pseudonocardia dioxanivorans CB1190]PKV94044.1 hypothetical protein ATK30_4913 [Amycolatopsis niigatensis]
MDRASPWNQFGELAATALALLAAAAAGAELFALSATERWQFQDLLLYVGAPAAGLLILVVVVAAALRWQRLVRGIGLGAAAGVVATVGLEAVRITGFRVFDSMPGDLPTLMGVKATGRIMLGPDTAATIIGYADHFWNGAMFGVIFALVVGGFPARRGAWVAAVIGAVYGLALGFGFVTGPVPRSLGIGGIFSTVGVGEFQTTVYLAHLVFGALLGLLVHRFGSGVTPLWTAVLRLGRTVMGREGTAATRHRK